MASIEASRAFAATAVVLMHAANAMRVEHFSGHVGLMQIFDFGYVGVDFFFVLSGFIITYVHFGDIGQIGKIPSYLWRRFSRIFPIYWVILLLVILVTTCGRLATGKEIGFEIGINDIAGTIFLLISADTPKYVGPAWSLQFELMFYISFCLLLFSSRIGALLYTLWGVFAVTQVLGLVQYQFSIPFGNAHCLQFLFGVVVGVIARRHHLQASQKTLALVLAIFVMGLIFEVYGPLGRHSGIGRIVLGLASSIVLATLVGLENNCKIQTPQWLVRMGSVSYSIYLGHILFVNLAYMVLLKLGIYHALPEIFVFVIGITVALTATSLIGFYVELPLVNTLKNYWIVADKLKIDNHFKK